MVVIKEFEMPRNCEECPYSKFDFAVDQYRCAMTGHYVSYDFERDEDSDLWKKQRHIDCPLIEVDLMQMVLDAMEQNNKPLDPEKEKQNKAIAEAILIGDGRNEITH